MMSETPPRVPIGERGGRTYEVGTLYYSRERNGFFLAGLEKNGPVNLDTVSGNIRWNVDTRGRFAMRDETGVFIPRNVFSAEAGTLFGSGLIKTTDQFVARDAIGAQAGADQQFVERITYLRPDGRIVVREIPYGIGNEYDPSKKGKAWFYNGQRVLETEGERPSYDQIKAAILSSQIILRTNEGPVL